MSLAHRGGCSTIVPPMKLRGTLCLFSWWLLTSAPAAFAAAAENNSAKPAPALTPIQLTCVDAHATGYGTFQSHNQKVVSNRRGIFMTHLHSRNEAYTAQAWRLSWSTNGGESFMTLFAATNATNPPL